MDEIFIQAPSSSSPNISEISHPMQSFIRALIDEMLEEDMKQLFGKAPECKKQPNNLNKS